MDVGRADINQLLAQMREIKAQTQSTANTERVHSVAEMDKPQGTSAPSFSDMFGQAIDAVNETQQSAKALATAYEKGEPGVSLSQVMVASQKASVSFEAITQVRNKLVTAYKDVMSMPL